MADAVLNRKLNIVLSPITTAKGKVHVHSVPVGLTTFRDNCRYLGRVWTAIQTGGYGPVTGPTLAAYLVMDEARREDNEAAVEKSLMNEIRRLTNVIYAGDRGWESMPFLECVKRGVLTDEEAAETENLLVYFTCASWMKLPPPLDAMAQLRTLWGALTISSTATDYKNSLPMPTQDESTGENVTPLPERRASAIPV